MRANKLRHLAEGCLPEGASLKTDRGRALYVSNCPEARSALETAGFYVAQRGALITIDLTRRLLPVLEGCFLYHDPDDALLRQLGELAGRDVRDEELRLLTLSLKALERGGAAKTDPDKQLRRTAALCLRSGGGGALALACRIQRTQKEERRYED